LKLGSVSWLVLSVCGLLWVWDAWGLKALRSSGTFLRFERADAATFARLDLASPATPEIFSFYKPKLAAAGFDRVTGDTQRIVFILEWVMNHVGASAGGWSASALDAYQGAQEGRALSCDSMSRVFVAAARAEGFTARSVQLVRTVLNSKDTHVTAEVRLNNGWVIFDPTFNVSFARDGRLLGVQEMHEALLDGSGAGITPVFYGEVRYPARLQHYYLDWMPLYNNVFILEAGHHGLFARMAPFRFWLGPRWVYLESQPTALWQWSLANQDYVLYTVLLPMLATALSIGLLCSTTWFGNLAQRRHLFSRTT